MKEEKTDHELVYGHKFKSTTPGMFELMCDICHDTEIPERFPSRINLAILRQLDKQHKEG